MEHLIKKFNAKMNNPKAGMEMVQVAILIAIAIAAGIIFRTQIAGFINNVFSGLKADSFQF